MVDLASIINAAFAQAVEQAVKPLAERIAVLEAKEAPESALCAGIVQDPGFRDLLDDLVRNIVNDSDDIRDAIREHERSYDHSAFVDENDFSTMLKESVKNGDVTFTVDVD